MELEIEQFYKFSRDGTHFLSVSSDNKGKVYDTYSQNLQQFIIEDQILNSYITCADILIQENKNIICVFGNSKGEVTLYDINKSQKIFKLQLHSKNVLDVAFNESGDGIYTVSSDKFMKKVDIKLQQEIFSKEVKKRGFIERARILSFQSNQVVYSVDNKITLFDIDTNNEIQKYSGHSQHIQMIRKSNDGKYFLSFSNEGYVNIYGSEQNTPYYTLNVLNQSKLINMEIQTLTKKRSNILLHHIDQINLIEVTIEPLQKPIEKPQSYKLNAPILYSSLENKSNSLQIVHGSTVDMKFKSIGIFEQQSKQKNNKQQKAPLKQQISHEQIQSSIDNLLAKSVKIASNLTQNISLQKEQAGTYVVGENDFDKQREVQKAGEQDLEDQLEKVGILSNLKKYTENQNNGNNVANGEDNNVKSLAVVLLQGLHNNDQQLLDFCLQKDEDELIENTVKKILANKVGKLIENVTDRISRYPHKANVLCKWLKYIIKYHNSILISTPAIHQKLGPLLTMIESRTKNLNKIIALRGKIDMVLALKRARQVKQQQIQEQEQQALEPLVVYQEGEEQIEERDEQIQNEDKSNKRGKRREIDDSVTESEGDEEEGLEDYDDEEDDIDQDFDEARKQAMHNKDDFEEEEDMGEEGQSDSNYMEF